MTRLSQTMKDTIERYAEVTSEIKYLNTDIKKKEVEQKELFKVIIEKFDQPVTTPYGLLSVVKRRTWGGWPQDVLDKVEELKELKASTKKVGNSNYENVKGLQLK